MKHSYPVIYNSREVGFDKSLSRKESNREMRNNAIIETKHAWDILNLIFVKGELIMLQREGGPTIGSLRREGGTRARREKERVSFENFLRVIDDP